MPIRYSLLTSCLLLLTVQNAPAFGIPDPAHSTVPPCLVVCPRGDIPYTVVVRDIAGNPVVGCEVVLDFVGCPSSPLCADCCPGLTVDRQSHRVATVSGPDGAASFQVKMGLPCWAGPVGILACGIFLGPAWLSSPDYDGDLAVTVVDASAVQGLIGNADRAADFDCDGLVTQADLDWLNANHLGHFCGGIVPTRPSSWGSLKLIYR